MGGEWLYIFESGRYANEQFRRVGFSIGIEFDRIRFDRHLIDSL